MDGLPAPPGDLSHILTDPLLAEVARRIADDLSLRDRLKARLPKLHEFPVIVRINPATLTQEPASEADEPPFPVMATIAADKGVVWFNVLVVALEWRARQGKDAGLYDWYMKHRDVIYRQAQEQRGAARTYAGTTPQDARTLKAMATLESLVVAAMGTDAFRTLADLRGTHPKGTRRKAKLTPAESRALYTRLLPFCRKTATGRVKPETRAMEAVSRKACVTVRTIRDYLKRT
jgi:hypothetical protein